MAARIASLLCGSSGTFMIMAGLERKELLIQTTKAILITFLAVLFTKEYELKKNPFIVSRSNRHTYQ